MARWDFGCYAFRCESGNALRLYALWIARLGLSRGSGPPPILHVPMRLASGRTPPFHFAHSKLTVNRAASAERNTCALTGGVNGSDYIGRSAGVENKENCKAKPSPRASQQY